MEKYHLRNDYRIRFYIFLKKFRNNFYIYYFIEILDKAYLKLYNKNLLRFDYYLLQ